MIQQKSQNDIKANILQNRPKSNKQKQQSTTGNHNTALSSNWVSSQLKLSQCIINVLQLEAQLLGALGVVPHQISLTPSLPGHLFTLPQGVRGPGWLATSSLCALWRHCLAKPPCLSSSDVLQVTYLHAAARLPCAPRRGGRGVLHLPTFLVSLRSCLEKEETSCTAEVITFPPAWLGQGHLREGGEQSMPQGEEGHGVFPFCCCSSVLWLPSAIKMPPNFWLCSFYKTCWKMALFSHRLGEPDFFLPTDCSKP